MPGRLRDVRDDVRADALPARDLRGDAVVLAVLAEVGAPREADDHDVDGIPGRGDAELAVAVERDRPEVAGGEPVGRDRPRAPRNGARRPSTGDPCTAPSPSSRDVRGGRAGGRRPGPSACRSSGSPRTRRSRSSARATRRGSSRPPSRRARRSSRSSRSLASRSALLFVRTNRRNAPRRRPADAPGRAARARTGRFRPCAARTRRPPTRAGAGRARVPSAPRRPSVAETERPRPVRNPVASSTSRALATRAESASSARATLRGIDAPVARDEREHRSLVAHEDERLHDLVELAAGGVGCVRAVGVPSGNSWMRASAPESRRNEDTRSTGSGQAPTTPVKPTFAGSVDVGDEPEARPLAVRRVARIAGRRSRSSTLALNAQRTARAAVPASPHGDTASAMPAKNRIPPE